MRVAPGALRVECRGLAVGGRTLIDALDVRVEAGTIVTVMGPSGSGKSTLLSWICGTLDRSFTAAGRVWLHNGELTDLSPEARRVGILFQDDLLFPHLSVGD